MITIDAENKALGRVAAAAAKALLGKHKPTFAKNVVDQDGVKIINASKVFLSGVKGGQKTYLRYSGYAGGLKEETYDMLVARRGHEEAIRQAVKGMLPHNRLQAKRMKMLSIEK
ncbi:MAG TPA: 50S ribosomal protein L13 [Candidatus Paceibacterota bacterium]|nr:50S ribosomal protein L13 [Candidatus Paceibacterota bacterium]